MFKPIHDPHLIKTANAMHNVPNAMRDYYFHLRNIDHAMPENPLFHIPTSEDIKTFRGIEHNRKINHTFDLCFTIMIGISSIISRPDYSKLK